MFCKGDNGLEDEECSGWPSEVDNEQQKASSKLILSQLHKELLKNIDHSAVVQHLKHIGKVKKPGKWVSCELTENLKKWLF